jgi:hypothetical protein
MARLASQEKMEFYPTPEAAIIRGIKEIKIETPIRALDPCAGDGRALKILKENNNAEVYGIELDVERSKQTAEITGKKNCLFETDALIDARVSAQAFNLIFNNPPYDWERGYGDSRLELTFIERYASPLVEGGIMILIINESLFSGYSRAKEFLTVLLKNFAILSYFKMTEDETYKQWVLILRKGKVVPILKLSMTFSDSKYEDELKQIEDGIYNENYRTFFNAAISLSQGLRPNLDHDDRTLTVAPKPLNLFSSVAITEEMIEKALAANGKTINIALEAIKPKDTIETLLPLRNSHLPLLLSTGYLNGRVKGTNLVINGQTERFIETYEETEEKQDKNVKPKTQTVEKEINKFRATLKVLDLKTKEVIQIN